MHIRQDALDLFGFADMAELNCFKMLIGVTGVGPKAALAILSAMTPERFALCVASGDHKSIMAAQGVGAKLAQRIILELRDKVSKEAVGKGFSAAAVSVAAGGLNGNAGEAISALTVLGYSQADAASAIAKLDPEASVEDMIKAGLKALASKL
jgi:Holliday junction DNA helicase RuvA